MYDTSEIHAREEFIGLVCVVSAPNSVEPQPGNGIRLYHYVDIASAMRVKLVTS